MADQDKPRTLVLSPAQVAGSALAAITGAFFASWAGTAGTVIGAALGSVFATVGGTLYTAWLRRSAEAMRITAARAAVKARPVTLGPDRGLDASAVKDANARRGDTAPLDTGELATQKLGAARAQDEGDAAHRGDPVDPSTAGRLQIPWARVGIAAAVVLIASLGVITAFEGLTGKPLSSLVGRDSGTGTTVGRLTQGGGDRNADTPSKDEPRGDEPSSSPSDRPSGSPSASPSRESSPSASATPDEPDSPTPAATPDADSPQGGPTGQ